MNNLFGVLEIDEKTVLLLIHTSLIISLVKITILVIIDIIYSIEVLVICGKL